MLYPAGYGWKWEYDPELMLWFPIANSRLPETPPHADFGIETCKVGEQTWLVGAVALTDTAISSSTLELSKRANHLYVCTFEDRSVDIGGGGKSRIQYCRFVLIIATRDKWRHAPR